MLTIRCTLLRDTFEAGAWDDPTAAEWPPSPMRLFSALVAVADPADDKLLLRLEAMPPPEIHAPPVLPAGGAGGWYRRAFVPTNAAAEKGGSPGSPGEQTAFAAGRAPYRARPRSGSAGQASTSRLKRESDCHISAGVCLILAGRRAPRW